VARHDGHRGWRRGRPSLAGAGVCELKRNDGRRKHRWSREQTLVVPRRAWPPPSSAQMHGQALPGGSHWRWGVARARGRWWRKQRRLGRYHAGRRGVALRRVVRPPVRGRIGARARPARPRRLEVPSPRTDARSRGTRRPVTMGQSWVRGSTRLDCWSAGSPSLVRVCRTRRG
jgi:hypothetical protein